MSKSLLLFYEPSPNTFSPKLKQLCALQGLSLHLLSPGELDRTLDSLARPGIGELPGLPLPEPLLVFCGLSDHQLDRALRELRRLELFCLKAVRTPHNGGWTLRELYRELVKERLQLS